MSEMNEIVRREEGSTVWGFLRVFKTAHCKVDDFRKGRTRQPDHEFLADCGVEAGTDMARIALAVRRAVAGSKAALPSISLSPVGR
jgi:hypothetical protein